MTKRILALLMAIVMVITMCPTTAFAAEDSNASVPSTENKVPATNAVTETKADLEIATVDDLLAFAAAVNAGDNFAGKKVQLTADIDLAGIQWQPIGGSSVYFAGEFDGNGKTISNLTNTEDVARKGLFGLVEKCYIHDLTLKNVKFSGDTTGARIGALAGNLQYYNVIENVTIDGLDYDLNDTDGLIGGLAGYVWTSYVKNCVVKNADMNIGSTGGSSVGVMIAYGRGVGDARTNFPYADRIAEADYQGESLWNYCDSKVDGAVVKLSGTVTFGGFLGADTYNSWRNYAHNNTVTGLEVICAEGDGVYTVGGFMGGQYGGIYTEAMTNNHVTGSITSYGTNTASTFGGFYGYVGGRPGGAVGCTADVDIKVVAGDVGGFCGETQQYLAHEYEFNGCEAKGDVYTEEGTAGGFIANIQHGGDGSALNVVITGSVANGTATSENGTAEEFIGNINNNKNGADTDGKITMDGNTVDGKEVTNDMIGGKVELIAAPSWDKTGIIMTAADLQAFAAAVNAGDTFAGKTIQLGADIDLAGTEWTTIGAYGKPFSGEFDGNGKTISNLTDSTTADHKGLFAHLNEAYVHDLTLKDVKFSGTCEGALYAGALVGEAESKNVIKNVTVDGITWDITSTNGSIGGIAGYTYDSNYIECTVNNAVFNVTSTSSVNVGGMIGQGRGVGTFSTAYGNTNTYSYDTCKVNGMTANVTGKTTVGGFIGCDGYNHWANYGINCTVIGLNVTCAADDAQYTVGGFMGSNNGANYGKDYAFENCTTTGVINAEGNTNTASTFGGFVGYVGGRPLAISNCTADVTIKVGAGDVGGFCGETQQYFAHEYKFEGCEANGNVSTGNGNAGGFIANIQHGGDGQSLNVVITGNAANGTATSANGTAEEFIANINDKKNDTATGGEIVESNNTVNGEAVTNDMIGGNTDLIAVEVAKNETTGDVYISLQAAINAAGEGDTITLMANITETGIKVAAGQKITINFANHMLTGAIYSEGDLTVKNGAINSETFVSAIESYGENAKLTVEKMLVASLRHALRIEGGEALIISSWCVTMGNTTASDTHAINAGGAYKTTVYIVGYNSAAYGPKNSEHITSAHSGSAVQAQANATVYIEGGEFGAGQNNTLQVINGGKIIVYGGTFDQDPSAYVAEGYILKQEGDMYIAGAPCYWHSVADTSWYTEENKQVLPYDRGGNTFYQDTYVLTTPQQLAGLAELVNAGNSFAGVVIKLGADIDLEGVTLEGIVLKDDKKGITLENLALGEIYSTMVWKPIGLNEKTPFSGHFDGQNHTIKGLYAVGGIYNGLFGYVKNNTIDYLSSFQNVTFENVTMNSGVNTGALLGGGEFAQRHEWYGGVLQIHNIKVTGDVDIKGTNAGAVIGDGWLGVRVDASNIVIDVNEGSYVYGSEVAGGAFASAPHAGGQAGKIEKITSNIDVRGDGIVGGIAGIAGWYWDNVTCTGNITATGENAQAGTIFGQIADNNYWSNNHAVDYAGMTKLNGEGATLTINGETSTQLFPTLGWSGKSEFAYVEGKVHEKTALVSIDGGEGVLMTWPEAMAEIEGKTAEITLTLANGANMTTEYGIKVPADTTLTIDLNGCRIYGNIFSEGDLTVKNGHIYSYAFTSAIESYGENAVLTIEDGVTIKSYRHAIRAEGGKVVINGGVFQTWGREGQDDTVHALNAGGAFATTVTINGGTFNGIKYDGNAETPDSGAAVNVQNNATVTINGGKFGYGQNFTLQVSGSGVLTITGGEFDQDPAAYAAYGYEVEASETEGWFTVVESKTLVITNLDELKAFRDAVNNGKTFEGCTILLAADIDLGNEPWTPIGYGTYTYIDANGDPKTAHRIFSGIFDGQGHTISNLYINQPEVSRQGLFGCAGGSTIKNLTIHNANVTGNSSVAVLVGHGDHNGAESKGHVFENIKITGLVKVNAVCGTGTVLGTAPNVGITASNIVVDVEKGSIVDSTRNITEDAPAGYYYSYTGGVFGQVWGSSFTDITSNIDVTGACVGTGGITGGATGTWKNITCTGDVIIAGEKDMGYWYTNKDENGNAYGLVYWWQGAGLISGYHGGTTFENCVATGTLTYLADTTHTNEIYYNATIINPETRETIKTVALCDSRFGSSRWSNDNTITVIDYAELDEGGEVVENVVVYVGETGFTSLQAAINAICKTKSTGNVITFVADIVEKGVKVPAGGNVVIDMNGFTLYGDILSEGNLTIKNGTIKGTRFVSAIESCGENASLTVENLEVISYRHALRIEGGVATIISGTYQTLGGVNADSTTHALNAGGAFATTVTINGGTFLGPVGSANTNTADSGAAVMSQNNATVTINGGKFGYGQNHTLATSGTGKIVVTAGLFDQDPTAYVAEGYKAVSAETEGWYIVELVPTHWIQVADTSWYVEGQTEFTITTPEQLAGLAKLVNNGNKFTGIKITLGADIDLAGLQWTPIGEGSVYFAGEFDGNRKTISNMTNTEDTSRKGLFGLVEKSYIHDLTLKDVVFSGTASDMRVGALAGNLQYYNVIENITIDGLDYDLKDTDGLIGGLAGYAWTSYVKNCVVKNADMNITSTGNSTVGVMIAYGRGVGDARTNFPYADKIAEADYQGDSVWNYVGCEVEGAVVNLSGTVTFGGFLGSDTYNHWRNYGKNNTVTGLEVICAEGDGVYTVGGFMGAQYGGYSDAAMLNNSVTGSITSYGTNPASTFGGFYGWVGGRPGGATNCTANVNITVKAGDVGGFVGETQQYFAHAYSFVDCTATGDVTTENGTAGGFIANAQHGGDGSALNVTFKGCEATGSVTGTTEGGFIGTINDNKNNTATGGDIVIENCTAVDGNFIGNDVNGLLVARVGNNYYSDLDDAITAVAEGGKVVIIAATEITAEQVEAAFAKNVTIIKAAELNVTAPAGYFWKNGTTLAKAVAKIGDTYYADLQDAIFAVEYGQTITLLTDIAVDSLYIAGKSFTLNMNGKNLTVAAGLVNSMMIVGSTVIISGGGSISGGGLLGLISIGSGAYLGFAEDAGEINGKLFIESTSTNYVSMQGGKYPADFLPSDISTSIVMKGEDVYVNAPAGYFWQNGTMLAKAIASVTATDGTVKYYASVEDAFGAALHNNTVTLLSDCEISKTIKTAFLNIILDLNGHKLSTAENFSGTDMFTVTRQLTVKGEGSIYAGCDAMFNGDVTIEGTGAYTGKWTVFYVGDNANVAINGGTFTSENAAVLSVSGTNYNVTKAAEVEIEAPADYRWQNETKLVAIEYVAQIGASNKYETLAEAFEAAKAMDEATIVVLRDITFTDNTVDFIANVSGITGKITLDLNGKTITSEAKIGAFRITCVENGTFILTDSSAEQTGKIYHKVRGIQFQGQNMIMNGGTIESGNVALALTNTVTFTMNSGKLVGGNNGISVTGKVVVNIAGGEITSQRGVTINAPEGILNISGGTITGSVDAILVQAGTVNITGGIIDGDFTQTREDAIISISGGIFNGAVTSETETQFITGGIFKNEPAAEYIAESYVVIRHADGEYQGMYEVIKAPVVNTTTGIYYATLEEAVDAANDGDTVTLLADVSEQSVVIKSEITLNLNGHTLTVSDNDGLVIKRTATVKNGTIIGKNFGITVNGAGNATLEELTVTAPGRAVYADRGVVTIVSGTYIAKTPVLGRYPESEVIILGGTFQSTDTDAVVVKGAIVTITDGTFYGKVVVESGSMAISGGVFKYEPVAEHIVSGYAAIEREDGMFEVVSTNDSSLTIDITALGAESYIGVQFILNTNAAKKYDKVYVVVTEDGVETVLDINIMADYGMFDFEHKIPAYAMTRKMTVVAYGEKDGVVFTGVAMEVSVKDIAVDMLDRYNSTEATAKQQKLAVVLANLLNYGAESQKAFGEYTNELATDGLAEKHAALIRTEDPVMSTAATTQTNNGITDVTLLTRALSVGSTVEMQLIFDFHGADVSNYEVRFNYNGKDYVINGEDLIVAGKWNVAVFNKIVAEDLRETVTATVYKKGTDEAVSETFSQSVESIAATMLNGQYAATCKAIMHYCDAAKEYFAEG